MEIQDISTEEKILLINQLTLNLIKRLGTLSEMAPLTWPRQKTAEEILIEKQLKKMGIVDEEGCFLDCWLNKEIDEIWEEYL